MATNMEQCYLVGNQGEQLVQVADLGSFSMREIYEALVANSTEASRVPTTEKRLAVVESSRNCDGEDSDCSWTYGDDTGTFYADMRWQIEDFALDSHRTTMSIPILSRRRRRFVHAIAQTMGLGHASQGAHGCQRPMIVFKHESAAIPALDQVVSFEQQNAITSSGPMDDDDQILSLDSQPKKRKRFQKINGGFTCQFSACDKVFDRASERTKHEQTHQPQFTNRFQCFQCNKGFRYPKDLKRHHKVHEKTTKLNADPEMPLLSCSPPTSTLASESRVPSETSLTFSSNTVSKDNSPFLTPRIGGDGFHVEMEPLVLNADAWIASSTFNDDTTNLPFQEFYDFSFEQDDLYEDGFLEMARMKK